MEILEIRALNVPNIYSLKEQIIKMRLKLDDLADVPSKDIKGFNEEVIRLFPGLKDHKCSTGYVGGFVDRLYEGTYLAHVTEHLCLELQRILGHDLKYGKARQEDDDIYNVIFACFHPTVGRACGLSIVNLLNKLIEQKQVDFSEELIRLKQLCMKYHLGAGTGAIVEEAKRRGIPVCEVGESGLIRLGYGKYQKYISASLFETANLNTGGEAIDCRDLVHPQNRKIAELAAKSIGLDIAGIDIVIPDISKPMEPGRGAIVEVNAVPGIRRHLSPSKGKPRDVIAPILDMVYPEGTLFSIPIIAITGTNGKTTTTRMISHVIRQSGLTVGTTTTHGIYINEKCIEKGDTTGPRSARRILNDRSVEAAVLETARGGIVRSGLAFNKADIAVFTNLSEDHLEIDGIKTMEELLNVKSLLVEAVKETGTCVLNADDPWIMKIRDRAKGNILLFSMDFDNTYLRDHIKNRGTALYVKGNDIYMCCNGSSERILGIGEIPATLNGALKHNIYNSMACIGTCIAAGMSMNIIRKAIKMFSCSVEVNPGRFNIYDLGPIKVVLDYGHNLDGYRVTVDGLRNLNPKRLVGIIGVPGDRRDEDIRRIGQLSGKSFDQIIIKEDKDLRGRKSYEIADILLAGALESGIPRERVSIIDDEEEPLNYALVNSKEGDTIVVFFEKMGPLINIIKEFKQTQVIHCFGEGVYAKEPAMV